METNLLALYKPTDKFIVKSKACYQYDDEGKTYIDFESGVWCTNLGHSCDEIISIIKEQVEKSIHHGYKFRNFKAELLALKLNELIGYKMGQSVFLSSGSEAVNLAISLSQFYTKRSKILTLNNSYLSAFGFGRIAADNIDKIDIAFNQTEAIDDVDFNKIAAFVLETGGASVDMVQFPDPFFIQKLVRKAKEHGCLIIADEVTTGMGRMGKWFGYQHYDIFTDMVVTGKALGNGYPISAVTANHNISNYFAESSLRYAQSHQNDPLGCAIALEVINTMEQKNLIEKTNESGKYFKQQLELLQTEYPEKVKQIRARGLMLALEFSKNVSGETIHNYLFEHGFVVGFKANTLRFLPPLIITNTQIDKLITCLSNILDKR